MTIIEGLVYLILTMSVGAMVSDTDSISNASFCLICGGMNNEVKKSHKIIPQPEIKTNEPAQEP